MNYAQEFDRLPIKEQESLALLVSTNWCLVVLRFSQEVAFVQTNYATTTNALDQYEFYQHPNKWSNQSPFVHFNDNIALLVSSINHCQSVLKTGNQDIHSNDRMNFLAIGYKN